MMIHNGTRVSTIIPDWSGTISDDRQMVYHANLRVREQYGFPSFPFDEFIAKIRLTAPEAFREMGMTGTNEELQEIYQAAVAHVKEAGIHPIAYSDAAETLSTLVDSGVTLAVLSSHPEHHVRAEAEAFGLAQYFQIIVGSCHDKAIGIHEVLKQLDRPVAGAMYLGDTIYDVRAAKEAGVIAASISTGYMDAPRLMLEEPDYHFYSLSQIASAYNLQPT